MRSVLRAAAVGFPLALALLAGGAAASVVLEVDEVPDLPPGSEAVAVPVRADVRCDSPGVSPTSRIRFATAGAPEWLEAAFEPAEREIPVGACVSGPAVIETKLRLRALPDAPGLEAAPVDLVARAATGVVEESSTVPIAARAALAGAVAGRIEDADRRGAPQTVIAYPVSLVNGANADMRVNFTIVGDTGGFTVPVPKPLTIARGDAATFQLAVLTPFETGRVEESARFALRVLPSAALDPSVAPPPFDLVVSATASGWYAPGPGPIAAIAVSALVAAARISKR